MSFWDDINKAVAQVADQAADAIHGVSDTVGGWGGHAAQAVGDAFNGAVNTIVDAGHNALTSVTGVTHDAVTQVISAFESTVDNVRSAVASAYETVGHEFEHAFGGIRQLLQDYWWAVLGVIVLVCLVVLRLIA